MENFQEFFHCHPFLNTVVFWFFFFLSQYGLLCLAFTPCPELYWPRCPRIAFFKSKCERAVSSKRPAHGQAIIYFSNGAQYYFSVVLRVTNKNSVKAID